MPTDCTLGSGDDSFQTFFAETGAGKCEIEFSNIIILVRLFQLIKMYREQFLLIWNQQLLV